MNSRSVKVFGLALSFFVCLSVAVQADVMLDTVDWAADTSNDGAGKGTLAGGTINVTYSTYAGGNAGLTIPDDWVTSLATSPAITSVTYQNAGIVGTTTAGSPTKETITFSATVTNPYLLFDYTDATTTMNFGSLPITLVNSNNAQLSGDIIKYAGSSNTVNDGIAIQVMGTFGPGSPLTFTYTTAGSVSNFDSAAFTVGLGPMTAVPEPSSLVLGSIALFAMTGIRVARRIRSRRLVGA